ncbi:MAG: hypothetical protein N3I35_12750 [Clostridia bacterium]|nr:hypothetical protein [Clostridia bacterium]
MSKENCNTHSQPCPQLPGTVLRIFIPAGAVINLLNLIELSSPSGICVIIRLPFLGGKCSGVDLMGIMNSIRSVGGTVELA